MPDTPFPHEARADLPGVPFSAMRAAILAQARETKLTVLEDGADHLTVETAHGLIGLRPGVEAETAGMVAARDARWLFVMKSAVIAQMRQMMPAVAEAMRWSESEAPGSLPPNFQFVRATRVERLGRVFLRVTLQGEDLSAYGDAAIHFRLVQPPRETEPAWPSVGANGSTVWPEGPGAPHKPVYTVRHIDHDTNTLETDVFIHAGGRTTAWAEEIIAGERDRRIVGLVGPAGAGLLDAERVIIASDETGFPAAARLLDGLQAGATGRVILEAEHGADCAYPITIPPGLEVTWLARAKGQRLGALALEALGDWSGHTIWFAGEKGDAKRLRDAAKAAGWEAGQLRVSGFWKRPEEHGAETA
ncbi:MAG: siderophore-interacting protein [Pseudomonadota bacterium]